jgi:hypothetical protein
LHWHPLAPPKKPNTKRQYHCIKEQGENNKTRRDEEKDEKNGNIKRKVNRAKGYSSDFRKTFVSFLQLELLRVRLFLPMR